MSEGKKAISELRADIRNAPMAGTLSGPAKRIEHVVANILLEILIELREMNKSAGAPPHGR